MDDESLCKGYELVLGGLLGAFLSLSSLASPTSSNPQADEALLASALRCEPADTDQSLRLLPQLIPRTTLPLDPVLLAISTLGDSTHSLPPRAGKVDYAVQRHALEQLAALVELSAVGREGLEALDRLYGAVEQGLQYRILRCVRCPTLRRACALQLTL